MTTFERGDQVVCIPVHARLPGCDQKDWQYGFVTSLNADETTVFCRFWQRGAEGWALRTVANSEGCNPDDLLYVRSAAEEKVAELLESLYGDPVG